MATIFLFGKYSSESLKGISADRTQQANAIIEKNGGQVKAMYALLGEYDLVLIVDLPDVETAMKTSISLTRLSGIAFSSAAALPVENFDKLVGGA